jgi:hypothetical protein
VDNLALRLAFVGTVCVWKQRSWLNSMRYTMDGTVGGEILCDLTSVDNDGTLHWAFRNKGVDVPREALMPFELASIFASTDRGEIQLDGKG